MRWVEEGYQAETKVRPGGSCQQSILMGAGRDDGLIPDAPIVPRIKSRRMAITRLSLFQRTTARQAQIMSLSIYCPVLLSIHKHQSSSKRTITRVMVAPTAIITFVRVEDHIPPLVGSRNNCICWNPSAVSSTSAMRPNMNIKVVIQNMKILGGEDKKPGLPLKVSFSCQCRPLYSQKHGPCLTEGCGLRQRRV